MVISEKEYINALSIVRSYLEQVKIEVSVDPDWELKLNLRLDDFDFYNRVLHCFQDANLNTVRDIITYHEEKNLLTLRNFGKSCIIDVFEVFDEKGIKLPKSKKHQDIVNKYLLYCKSSN